jgi:pyruvate decarboxylase
MVTRLSDAFMERIMSTTMSLNRDYLKVPALFGVPHAYTASVRTYGDLNKVMQEPKGSNGYRLRVVEISMDRNDALAGSLLNMLGSQNGNA